MGKLFGIVSILVAMYIGMQIYTKGMDGTLDRAFGAIEASERDSSASGSAPTGSDATAPTERTPGRLTERVRDKVTLDLQRGAARSGG